MFYTTSYTIFKAAGGRLKEDEKWLFVPFGMKIKMSPGIAGEEISRSPYGYSPGLPLQWTDAPHMGIYIEKHVCVVKRRGQ